MPQVVYISADGARSEVPVPIGTSLMRGAAEQGVDGLPGDCGGTLSCATCHVFVEAEYLALLPAMSAGEDQMLEFTATNRRPDSRLSCQIVMSDALDGIRVHVAEHQV